MGVLEYIIGGILLVLAVALITLIGLQQGRRRGLGNSIAGQGASESYLAKNNIGGKDKLYQRITLIVAIVFVVLVLALYIIVSTDFESNDTTSDAASSAVTETSATESSEAESSDTESSEAESSDAESSEVESSDAESSEVESSAAESSEADSSVAG